MSELGVVGIDRGIFKDPTFKHEPFTPREAFIWIIAEAAWKEREFRSEKGIVTLNRSEFAHSVRFMADAWKWSKSRVSRFVQKLNQHGAISIENRDGVQVYIVNNYNRFQRVSLPERDSSGTTAGQQRDSSGTVAGQTKDIKNIQDIQDIQERESLSRPSLPVKDAFDIFCKAVTGTPIPCPKRLTKDRETKLKARLSEYNLAQWEIACRKLAASKFCRGDNDRGWVAGIDFILQPKSFNKLIEGQYDNRGPMRPNKPMTPYDALVAGNAHLQGSNHESGNHRRTDQDVSTLWADIEGDYARDDRDERPNGVVISPQFGAARR